ncbi:MAG: hypothetical protein HY749_19040 [Gammaproteobacteria bacterium]|nr:hypothetical protein [Gammaproteobacteria bacterium]MBI5619056.1 hypothetical protein [Gammaproteobacteria bacterium]
MCKSKRIGFLAGALLAAGVIQQADAASYTAVATGSQTPLLAPSSATVTNGDFQIGPNPGASTTGDGWDEWTTWSFDFNAAGGYPVLGFGAPLISATLTLSLRTPWFPGPPTDVVTPNGGGFNGIVIPTFITAADPGGNYGTGTMSFELLNRDSTYTSDSLLSFLNLHEGLLPMIYGDDAIVYHATLELSTDPLPLPGAVWLLAAPLAAIARRKRPAA